MKKILLIDEKTIKRDDGTGIQFFENLPAHLKMLVDLETSLTNAIKIISETEVQLLFDPNDYEWTFYHDSYKDKNLDLGQLESFKKHVPNLIIFSGGMESPSFSSRSTTRELLFSKLQGALEVYKETAYFPVKALCDHNIHYYYPLIEFLEYKLEQSDKASFISSSELKILLTRMNYSENVIVEKILPTYSKMAIPELYLKLNEWKFKNL